MAPNSSSLLSFSYRYCSCSCSPPLHSVVRRPWNPLPPITALTRPQGRSSSVTSAHLARTWPHTVRRPRAPSACLVAMTISLSCGTTCQSVCTAATFAIKTKRWRRSAHPQATGSVGVKRASTGPMTSVSHTPSASTDTVFKPKVHIRENILFELNCLD